jgi:predicted amidohydrolase
VVRLHFSRIRHYLSTDLTIPNRDVTVNMPNTISKLLPLRKPLEQAIVASGRSAAVKLGMDKIFGAVREGNPAVPRMRSSPA